MKNKIHTLLCLLTLGVFVLIFVQERKHVFNLKPLNGVSNEVKRPVLALNYIRDGSYQSDAENYLRFNLGFREWFIKTYNQYVWDFFHKTLNYTIYIGKENYLYGRSEIVNYYASSMYFYTEDSIEMQRQFDLEAMRLYKVQHILGEYGNFVFVTLLPAKSFIYPEFLPPNPGLTSKPFHAFEYYPRIFDSLGINYINVFEIFKGWKGEVDFPLYPKTGTHWSYIASAYAFDTIERYIEDKGNMNLHNYTIGEKHRGETVYPDNDLECVLNLWRPIKPDENFYADTQIDDDSTAFWPCFLIVGDSYFWNLVQSVPLACIFKNYYYWYYNSTVHFNPKYDHTNDADILYELLNAQIIDLSYSPEQLYVFSNGFLPKALLYLTHDDAEIDSTLNAIAATIVKDSEAERMDEAKKALFEHPELYFPDLAQDSIPATRNSRIPELLKEQTF